MNLRLLQPEIIIFFPLNRVSFFFSCFNLTFPFTSVLIFMVHYTILLAYSKFLLGLRDHCIHGQTALRLYKPSIQAQDGWYHSSVTITILALQLHLSLYWHIKLPHQDPQPYEIQSPMFKAEEKTCGLLQSSSSVLHAREYCLKATITEKQWGMQ